MKINQEFIMDAVAKSADVLLAYAANSVLIMPGACTESIILAANDLTPDEAAQVLDLAVQLQRRRDAAAMLERNLNNEMDG